VARPHEASLVFEYDSRDDARIVERSVAREVDQIADDRTRASIDRAGATVSIDVAAADLVALRAGINTWCSLVDVAESVAGTVTR
jgi:KEOPS complex subunit Pcc1